MHAKSLPNPGIEFTSLISPALADGFFIVSATWEALFPRCVVLCLVAQSCLTLCDPTECNPPGSSVLGDSPGKNTGVGCHALLQGIFPTQGLNPGPLHCRQILYHMSHQGSLRILEWVDYHFSRGSSWPCIAGRLSAEPPRKPTFPESKTYILFLLNFNFS